MRSRNKLKKKIRSTKINDDVDLDPGLDFAGSVTQHINFDREGPKTRCVSTETK